jgi:class I lanthipeptide synthase
MFSKRKNLYQKYINLFESEEFLDLPISLMSGGRLGVILLMGFIHNRKLGNINIENFFENIEYIFEEIDFEDFTLNSGLLGLVFTGKIEINGAKLDHIFKDEFDNLKYVVNNKTMQILNVNNYDYLDGYLGLFLVYYILNNENKKALINKIVSDFSDLNNIPRDRNGKINLGYAHGISGVLFIIFKLYKFEGNLTLRELLFKYYNFLISELNYKRQNSSFNNYYKEEVNSRLGWCYGDLSILFVLQHINKEFEINDSIIGKAINKTLERIAVDHTLVQDTFACHGSHGLTILYEQLYTLTDNDNYLLRSKYWDSSLEANLDLETFNESFISEKHSILSGYPSILFYNNNHKCKMWLELLLLQ